MKRYETPSYIIFECSTIEEWQQALANQPNFIKKMVDRITKKMYYYFAKN